jgi:hypothetical protein
MAVGRADNNHKMQGLDDVRGKTTASSFYPSLPGQKGLTHSPFIGTGRVLR